MDSFDPKFNVKLKTYAEHRIRGAILDSIRGLDGIPAHKRKRLKQMEAAIATAEQRLQRVPSRRRNRGRDEHSAGRISGSSGRTARRQPGQPGRNRRRIPESKLLRYVAQDEENQPARILERAELEKLLADAVNKMPRWSEPS